MGDRSEDGPDALVRAQLERLLASRTFSGSVRLQRLLRFIVEEAAAGRGDGLKEQVIALEVYGRGSEFDPSSQSLVRVDVRRLRDKVREYYESEGIADRLKIEILKGSYRPRFLDLHQYPPIERERVCPAAVAVLPFENLSGPEHEYLAGGLTDAVITELAKTKAMRVISRTSVMVYRGSGKPVPEAARELGVTHVVTGAVIQEAGETRLTCQLIQAKPESHVWAESYDLGGAEIARLPAEIAQSLAAQIPGSVRATEQREPLRSVHRQAYEAVLRGRQHWNRLTPHDLQRSLEYFQAALTHNPQNGAAYAGLADAEMKSSTAETQRTRRLPVVWFGSSDEVLGVNGLGLVGPGGFVEPLGC